jgi:hypothetical protein
MREPSADPQIQVRMSHDLRRAIEDFRRNEPDIPSRPEAIRRLLKQAVTARLEQTASNLHDLAQAG